MNNYERWWNECALYEHGYKAQYLIIRGSYETWCFRNNEPLGTMVAFNRWLFIEKQCCRIANRIYHVRIVR